MELFNEYEERKTCGGVFVSRPVRVRLGPARFSAIHWVSYLLLKSAVKSIASFFQSVSSQAEDCHEIPESTSML